MRKPIAAANWKMNGDFALVEAFAKHAWPQGNVEKIFGLPAIYISKAHELGLEILAGEDVSAHASGAHTGEISAAMLKEAGARYAIIGHSERRTDHGENEALLMRALAALMQDKTVLMIAHRLATIRHAAQILVFDHGQLVEQGDHASLIAQNGRYARLWQAGEAARHWRIGSTEQ